MPGLIEVYIYTVVVMFVNLASSKAVLNSYFTICLNLTN